VKRRLRPATALAAALAAATASAHAQTPQSATDAQAHSDAPKGSVAPGSPASASAKQNAAAAKPAASGPKQHFDIDDFAVEGAATLSQIDLEEAIYPFLGPNRTADDVEKARAALEKAYHDKGYQTVSVSVPQQNVQGKVVVLKVTEMKVGRLRVKGSRYFDIDKIKEKAPSLKEGTVPNFDNVTKDIVSLNQLPDRRVTPALRAGETPGTVDVDLNVEDKLPLHASMELNNRQSPNTTPLRVNGTIHYDNLWQLGHSFTFTYQVAPENPKDAEVFSASYLARIPTIDWLSVLLYGLTSSSNVATVGGTNVVGPGQVVGSRAVITLPPIDKLFHTLSVGMDYKRFGQTVTLDNGSSNSSSSNSFSSPVTYYPLVASYGATYQAESFTTQLTAAVTYNVRGLSSSETYFDNRRYDASASFAHFNLDLSHLQELPEGFQIYGRIQGQLADGPLVSSEQISVGGFETVRGYLESEVLGDEGAVGNLEFRSPNLGEALQKQLNDQGLQSPLPFASATLNEWRFFAFGDAGVARSFKPLPEQQYAFNLGSFGGGARFKALDYFNGMAAVAVPMISQTYTQARVPRFIFRFWGEF
jgi:hemolysin activation/secretion protein